MQTSEKISFASAGSRGTDDDLEKSKVIDPRKVSSFSRRSLMLEDYLVLLSLMSENMSLASPFARCNTNIPFLRLWHNPIHENVTLPYRRSFFLLFRFVHYCAPITITRASDQELTLQGYSSRTHDCGYGIFSKVANNPRRDKLCCRWLLHPFHLSA